MSRFRKDKSMMYITRYRDKRSGLKGWWVRFQWIGKDKQQLQKMFWDHHYLQPNGKRASLVDAKLYRDDMVKKLGERFYERRHLTQCPYYEKLRRRDNKSGVTGVFYTEYNLRKTNIVKGRPYTYMYWQKEWRASWVEPSGKKCFKGFNVRVHGHDGARRMAIAHRKSKEQELEDAWSKEKAAMQEVQ
jgi:hypothetical protein